MSDIHHYTYRVSWSPEDGEFVGTVAEFPSLSWLSSSQIEAFQGILDMTAETVADMQANGEKVPDPIADRHYSGRFVVRVTPEQHRELVLEAAEEKVSLNRLVSGRVLVGA
ncbi:MULTISPECIES: type II toxin-antitoxin system HicB family antitoxin [unclassified Bifidobacterium]|uniref:type II toxin-antitoxin system HicB family antitoxin n=1 Tax=unclassified Bifidobacterium TaxID=2608897 RepID=UPI0023F8548B|nr:MULTISPECIES: type II toxin-antitoxin system HicB family antitoxin [unclassified Bifidobacterium]WEV66080.1 toxin-antitoxin system HicB family antitoxin [Bifidobacterium sp. ESL0764]WEV75128.1 toxin-antitoxin system HicB family antitoxin [Bifidobacterium sp. ESL0800]